MRITTARLALAGISMLLLMVGGPGMAFGEYGGRYGGPAARFGTPRMGSGYDGRLLGSEPAFGQPLGGYNSRRPLADRNEAGIKAADDIFRWQKHDLRRRIDNKQILLHHEKIKLRPDRSRVIRLQRQIDDIQFEMDSKTLQHRLETLNSD